MLSVLTWLVALWQIAIPAPRGFVNDFAGVVQPAAIERMTQVITEVRDKTGGDIAVVTLPDLGGRAAGDVAVQIGRQWGVGGKGEAGNPRKNLGVVILLVPRKNHRPGSGAIFIATGRGAEGFLPDAYVGRVRDEMTPALAREDYSAGLETGVDRIAQAFAAEFKVSIGDHAPAPTTPPREPGSGPSPLLFVVLLLVVLLLSRGRILPWILLGSLGGRSSRGWSGGSGGGGWGGGGGGGGFGGFGGGGGFSGGGAGGSF